MTNQNEGAKPSPPFFSRLLGVLDGLDSIDPPRAANLQPAAASGSLQRGRGHVVRERAQHRVAQHRAPRKRASAARVEAVTPKRRLGELKTSHF